RRGKARGVLRALRPRRVVKTLVVGTADEWRGGLHANHASVTQGWLGFPKQATGGSSIEDKAALDEALGFGRVDSPGKRIDERRYARKFTPRRADSRWSEINKKRYAELKADGRLKKPGIERPPTARGYDPPPGRRALPSKLPAYIQKALARHP